MWNNFRCTKSGVLKQKAAISLNHVKIDERLLWRAHRNSPMLFQTVASPISYGLLFPKIWVRNPNAKLQSLLSQDFKFGRYIHRVQPNKSPLNIYGGKGAWAYPGTTHIF